jgi:hypothetical protein
MSAMLPIAGQPPLRARLRTGLRTGLRAAGGARRMAVHDEVVLAMAMAALLLAVVALSALGAGTVARPLFMLSALAIAVLAKRRSPWLYLHATLWVWLTAAFVRRMIEWHGGFNATDIVLVTPHLTALLIVPDILTSRGLLRRPGIGIALLLTGCLLYGLFVSFVRGDVLAGAFSATDWLVPLLYLYFFLCHAGDIDAAEPHVATFLTAGLLFVVPYALYQYFLMPAWDAAWMVNSGMGSLGRPLPMGSRVFGPMNGPLPLAIWGGTCIVLLAHFRNRLLLVLTPFLFLMVAITMVRAVYGSLALALVAGALTGRRGFGRLAWILLLAGLSGYAGIAVLNPQVVDTLGKRLHSMQDLENDSSARVRAEIYAQTPKLINDNPFGVGIGAQGRGSAAKGSGEALATVNIDSGPLSVFFALGWFAGPLYLLGMLLLLWRVLRVGRRHGSPVAATMAAAMICPLATFPFINVLGFGAVILWSCAGYVLAVDICVMARTAQARAPGPPGALQ